MELLLMQWNSKYDNVILKTTETMSQNSQPLGVITIHFEGTFTVNVTRDKVWSFITDPSKIASCLPDLEKMEAADKTHFQAVFKIGISFIKSSFNFQIEFAEMNSPTKVTIKARGKGTGSTVDLTATMELSDSGGDATQMAWKVDAMVGGTIAGVGSRLIGSTAEKKTAQFFECLKGLIES